MGRKLSDTLYRLIYRGFKAHSHRKWRPANEQTELLSWDTRTFGLDPIVLVSYLNVAKSFQWHILQVLQNKKSLVPAIHWELMPAIGLRRNCVFKKTDKMKNLTESPLKWVPLAQPKTGTSTLWHHKMNCPNPLLGKGKAFHGVNKAQHIKMRQDQAPPPPHQGWARQYG